MEKNNIKFFRKKRSLTQGQLASLINVTKIHVSRLERGQHLSLRLLRKIAQVLKCSITDLIEDLPEEKKEIKETKVDTELLDEIADIITQYCHEENITISNKDFAQALADSYLKLIQGESKYNIYNPKNLSNITSLQKYIEKRDKNKDKY